MSTEGNDAYFKLEVAMSDKKDRPTFIRAKKLTNATLKNNTVAGNADFLVAESADNLKMSGNKHLVPKETKAPWYKAYARELSLAVIAGLIVVLITVFYIDPWAKKDQRTPAENTKAISTK